MKIRDEDYIRAFGENLKKLRKGRHWSRETLAAYANIEAKQVYLLESGKQGPTLPTLLTIALAFEFHPKTLLEFEYDFGVKIKE